MEPIVNLLLLLLGAVLVLHGFRKEPKDKISGVVGILIVLLTGFEWVIATQEWFKQQPRSISPSARDAMVAKLRKYSGQSVYFSYVANDTEAYEFAQQLQEVLASAGWDIESRGMRVSGPGSPVGVELWLPTDELTDPVVALSTSLRDAGIAVTRRPSMPPPPGKASLDAVWILVGTRKD